MHTELVSDVGYKVQAVLVEEDEEEDVEEHEEETAETQPQPCTVATEPVQAEAGEQDKEEEEKKKEEDKEEEEEGLKQDAEHALLVDPVEVVQEEEEAKEDGEENDQSGDSQAHSEPAEFAESAVTGSPLVLVSCYFDLIDMFTLHCYTGTRHLFLNDVL